MLKISWDNILSKEKQLQKSNAIIDGSTKSYSLLSRNLMNMILYIHQKEQVLSFDIPLIQLRDMLKLTNNKDFKNRIEACLYQLSQPIALRDFTIEGKKISFKSVAFLDEPTIYKDGNKNMVTITIKESFLSAVSQKFGYTILEFMKLLECSTIFGYEIAQLLFRYKNLPNKLSNNIGRITKTIDELNTIFDTNYKYKSEMERKLQKAQSDISTNLKIEYFFFWDEIDNCFVFSWEKEISAEIVSCKFPSSRIKELAEWIYDHEDSSKILDKGKWLTSCIKKLKAGEWENAEKKYRGMLQHKYNLLDPDMFYDKDTDKYIDFKEKKMRIAITSKKGGATKSTQAKELSFRFKLPILNLDIDSHIKEYYSTLDITDINENELIPHLDKCIYDFPAGDIFTKFPNTKEIIASCDLVIIPTLYASESVDRAIDTYKKIFQFNENILFVVSQTRDIENLKDTQDYIQSILNADIMITSITFSKGMENAEDNGCSIFDEAKKVPKLIAKLYRDGILKDYERLFELVSFATEEE